MGMSAKLMESPLWRKCLEGHAGGFFKEADDLSFAASTRSQRHHFHSLTDFSTSADYSWPAQANSSRHSERNIV
jgi:hypothetical protein